ncbi:MAG: hypothetical protein V2A56_11950 [bacterium]
MKKVKDFLNMALGFIVLGGLGYGFYSLTQAFIKLLRSLDPTLSGVLITVFGTILASTLTIVLTRYYEYKNNVKNAIREKKIPVYEELIDFLFDILFHEKTHGTKIDEKDMITKMSAITQKLIIWSSDDVLSSYVSWRKILLKLNEAGENMHLEVIANYGILLKNIRKDLGHKNKNIKPGDILSTFINDIK